MLVQRLLGLVGMFVLLLDTGAVAARPHEALLPDSTKGCVSIPDVDKLRDSWDKTQLGQLTQDPVMKPFAEDLQRQLREKWTRVYTRLGLTFDDLEGVPGGEVTFARIQPSSTEAAVAVIVDVTGHLEQAEALLTKVDKNLLALKADKKVSEVLGAQVTTYLIPPVEEGAEARQSVFFINDNILCATDHVGVAEGILSRFSGEPKDNLENLQAYRAVMARAKEAAGEMAPELRWYVDPFAYADTVRISDPSRKRKGKDVLKILRGQGFEAIQSLGGYINFFVDGRFEMLHRTMIYAPPLPGKENGERYELAARMLKFPNSDNLEPQAWVPRELATYTSFNVKIREAFEYAQSLVDAMVGEEGVFEDIIESLRDDPNGPQIDLREDLVAHLGERATVITDYELPINIKCERMVIAVETTDTAALAETINKTMQTDPDAHRREFQGRVIWEIVEKQDELPQLDIEVPSFESFGEAEKPKEEKRRLPNAAVCVSNGHLFVATHINFLKKILDEKESRERLANSIEYRLVDEALNELVKPELSFRAFSRTDEEFRPTYELIRMGKMPESQTMLGRLLNALLSEGDEGEIRPQRIDGHNLPEYEMIRRYLGPAGTAIHTENDGWFVQGISISKQSP